MTHEDYIGYALNLLDADERTAVDAHLTDHPEEAIYLDRIRAAIAPLALDRVAESPPPELATRTISRLAAELVEEDPHPPAEANHPSTLEVIRRHLELEHGESRSIGGRFRLDIIVALGIGLFAVGLALSFVGRLRQANETLACQNNLRVVHEGLSGYADVNNGRFPQVGTEAYPTAGSFVNVLKDAGQCPPGFHAICPALASAGYATPVSYTYALGHRTAQNTVTGQWRSADPFAENDLIPISADFPAASVSPSDGPTSAHGKGHNVLFIGGNVRFATLATVGVNGDDIYRNQLGAVAAGLTRVDTVLGRPDDVP